MNFVGELSSCSICGKRKTIVSQKNKLLLNQTQIDIYLECKDCASIPLWGRKYTKHIV